VSDTSIFDANVYEQQMITEDLRQQAANLQIRYWTLRMEKEGLSAAAQPAQPIEPEERK
jgi:hypothetical protein